MRAISAKAVLGGNIVNLLAAALVLPIIAAMAIGAELLLVLPRDVLDHADQIQIGRDITLPAIKMHVIAGVTVIWVGAALIAGYVGARLAKRALPLNAALATSLLLVVALFSGGVFSGFNGELTVSPIVNVLVSASAPLFAMLGGCLAMARRQPESAA